MHFKIDMDPLSRFVKFKLFFPAPSEFFYKTEIEKFLKSSV